MRVIRIETIHDIKQFLNEYRGYKFTFYNEGLREISYGDFIGNEQNLLQGIYEYTIKHNHYSTHDTFKYALLVIANIRINDKHKLNEADIVIINK